MGENRTIVVFFTYFSRFNFTAIMNKVIVDIVSAFIVGKGRSENERIKKRIPQNHGNVRSSYLSGFATIRKVKDACPGKGENNNWRRIQTNHLLDRQTGLRHVGACCEWTHYQF